MKSTSYGELLDFSKARIDPLAKYKEIAKTIDFSEIGSDEELAAEELRVLKVTEKMRGRATAKVLKNSSYKILSR
jgi:hypothetical protein